METTLLLQTLLSRLTAAVGEAGSDNLGVFGGAYEGGYHIQQRPAEFARLVCLLAAHSPFASYLEVGIAAGGTVRFLAEQLGFGRVAVIDDGRHAKFPVWLGQNRCRVCSPDEYVGDSHGPGATHFLRSLGRRFDLVGIDADHSYGGVRADWELVEPFLAPGAIVWFHDTVECEGVARWWGEVSARHTVLLETGDLGIGVLRHGR